MHRYKPFLIVLLILVIFILLVLRTVPGAGPDVYIDKEQNGKIISGAFDKNKFKTEEEWKKILTPKQYYILRLKGTEVPFTGKLNDEKRKGTFYSIGCDQPVFRSEQKYESGTGWPSFWTPIDEGALVLHEDFTLGERRIEVLDRCGGHLGHVFDDGPEPTGKRYCMNSEALYFVPDEE